MQQTLQDHQMHARVSAVVQAMDGWEHRYEPARGWDRHQAVRADGLTIRFHQPTPGRIGVDDILPDYPSGKPFQFSSYSKEVRDLRRSITVAATKDPARIAQDIRRRLVPDIEIRRRQALEEIAEETHYEQLRRDTIQRVCHLLCEPYRDEYDQDGAYANIGPYQGLSVRVGGPRSLTLTVNVDTLERAEALIRVMQPMVSPDRPVPDERPDCAHRFSPAIHTPGPIRSYDETRACTRCGWTQVTHHVTDHTDEEKVTSMQWLPPTAQAA